MQLSLAYRNDSYTLETRLKQAERERNLTEENTEKELEEFKGSLKVCVCVCVRVFAAAAAAAAVSIALAAGLASHASTSAVIRPASDGGREGKERDGVGERESKRWERKP